MLPALIAAAPAIIGALGGGKGGAPAGPTDVQAAVYGSGLDGSGWNVNFSGLQTNGSNKAGAAEQSAAGALGLGADGMSPLLIAGAVLIVGMAIWAKSKSKK